LTPTIFDLETGLIRPGLLLPPPAICTSYHPQDGARLWTTEQIPAFIERALSEGPVAGHDIGRFDLPVLAEWYPHLRPLIWKAFEEDRVWDTINAQRIIQIQKGEPGPLALSECCRRYGIQTQDKKDVDVQNLRLSFGQFIGQKTISPAHAEYALKDAVDPFALLERQLATNLVSIKDLALITRQSFWTGLVAARGFRTDPEHVKIFQQRVEEHLDLLEELAREAGFIRPNGVTDTKVVKCAVAEAYCPGALARFGVHRPEDLKKDREADFVAWCRNEGLQLPLSKSEKSIGTDKIVKADSGSPELEDLETWGQWKAAYSKDIDILLRGAVEPVHTRFSLANTLRVISSEPNANNFGKGKRPNLEADLQKLRKKPEMAGKTEAELLRIATARQKVWGIRECIAPRSGKAIVTTDIKGLENGSLAQCIIWGCGDRRFADKVNSGRDIHAELGAHILGTTYEDIQRRRELGDIEAEEARDCGKPGNFGLSGGMRRWQTLQGYARRGYNVRMSEERTKQVIAAYDREAEADGRMKWLKRANLFKNSEGRFDVQLAPSLSIWRRNVSGTDARNNPFQTLGALIATEAGWQIARGQYLTGKCPGNLLMFVYDDYTSECAPDDVAELAAFHEQAIEEAGQKISPDVIYKGDSRALTHLSKGIKAKKDANGRLIVASVEI
jgi:hypothetical protein